MGEAYFYHLTRAPVDHTLAILLERSLQQGWRVAVRAAEPEVLDALDEQLWLGPKERFLPHGRAGGPHDDRQPVLLTEGIAANDPQCLMALGGAQVEADEVTALDRVCILFDGLDGAAVAQARTQWTALTGVGIGARYWSEESGKWQEKASKNVP